MEATQKLIFEGKVFLFGDNIDTDVIIPARYLNTQDPAELATHCMEDIDRGFAGNVHDGDIIVAGENFGCGSSREHAPLAIKACGVACVVASSFARIFYRNAINIGLPILELKKATAKIKPGDTIEVDFQEATIKNRTDGSVYESEPFPLFMQRIIQAGGLINRIKQELGGKE